jgi:hypothetical protein
MIAALSLAAACASVGFMGGWFAARLAPAEPAVAVSDAGTVARTNRATGEPINTTGAHSSSQTTTTTAQEEKAGATPGDVSQDQTQATADQNGSSVPRTVAGATIINAGAAEGKAAARDASQNPPSTKSARPEGSTEADLDQPDRQTASERIADESLIARCARRYASFRASDGTYQPYDGGPRKLCALLR